MSGVMIAQVAVEQTVFHFDKPFDYYVPLELADKILPGIRVEVPFGRGNTKKQGIVIRTITASSIEKVKPILRVLDKEIFLSDEMLKLGEFISEHTFSPLYESLKPMLPPGSNYRIITKYRAKSGISFDDEDFPKLNDDETAILKMLIDSHGTVDKDRLLKICGLSSDSNILDRLVKLGLLERIFDRKRSVKDATVRMTRLTDEFLSSEKEIKLTPKQKSVVDFLMEVDAASTKEISYFTGVTPAVINALTQKGITEFFDEEILRNPYREKCTVTDTAEIKLSNDQQIAFDSMMQKYRSGEANATLLYGVTGSGKTSVYLKLIDEVLADGKQIIVMVPEISLTAQTLNIFHSRYGSKVAVFHSGLSLGQRLDEWKRVKQGEASIAVGTRSAIFAPFDNLGLIIMDEEQEASYKSESSPKFHARDAAKFRAAYNKALLVMVSATPSINSYSFAKSKKYSLCELESRYGENQLPQVIALDMREESLAENSEIISERLLDMLRENLEKKEQSILLLNRRGYNTYLSCRSCGEVITCPHCSISMTYHIANNRLMCHYCGYSQEYNNECPSCHKPHMRYSGIGTQKAEEELEKLLPDARIMRMDTDTTSTRFAHDEHFKDFSQGKYDIMLGTQMVAKGFDFPNVTLVGVLNADNAMYSGDYRGMEQTFSLLTQVVGRAGRGGKKGRAVIQTFSPEMPVIELAAKQDYKEFYKSEIDKRKLLIYPPYCELCVIGFVSTAEDRAKLAAKLFYNKLTGHLCDDYRGTKMILLGPAPAAISKISGKYRYFLTVKCHNNKNTRELIRQTIRELSFEKSLNSVTVTADFNPYYY